MTVGDRVMLPVSVACLELKIPGIPPDPHGLPLCVLDVFCCLDYVRFRIVAEQQPSTFQYHVARTTDSMGSQASL